MSAVTTPARQASGGVNVKIINRIVIYGLLALFALFYLMPLFVMLVTSFKTMDEIQNGNMLALPRAPTFDPWLKAWGETCVGLTGCHLGQDALDVHLEAGRGTQRCVEVEHRLRHPSAGHVVRAAPFQRDARRARGRAVQRVGHQQ